MAKGMEWGGGPGSSARASVPRWRGGTGTVVTTWRGLIQRHGSGRVARTYTVAGLGCAGVVVLRRAFRCAARLVLVVSLRRLTCRQHLVMRTLGAPADRLRARAGENEHREDRNKPKQSKFHLNMSRPHNS